jgi:hypothetical protein
VRKQQNYTIAVVLILSAVIASTPIFAQSSTLRANIPFDFYVADKLLPAGKYTITPTAHGDTLQVSGPSNSSVFVMTSGLKTNKATELSRLVFRRYGNTNFLSTVYWTGFPSGKELARSSMEKKLASNGGDPLPVAILIQ